MKLHQDKILFADIIARASEHPLNGGLGIRPQFIEKDYWITNALKNLSYSPYMDFAVFKGGTSLSKAYNIGMRFSEDIDIAVINNGNLSDAKLKSVIRSTEKSMSKDLIEINHPQSSKGSRYRKSFFRYPIISSSGKKESVIPGQLLLEINSFANPFPYQKILIKSFAYEYLSMIMRKDLIEEFSLMPFEINVLDKRTTMTEKLVSLFRFSLSQNPIQELEAKIRHFYDLHYLLEDKECLEYLFTENFKNIFVVLLSHDKELFDNPAGWKQKSKEESPLLSNFNSIWDKLKKRYETELPSLAYSLTIPDSEEIKESMNKILNVVREIKLRAIYERR